MEDILPAGPDQNKSVDDAGSINRRRLWQIDGKLYDLEPFLHKHPGGRRLLEQVRGTDCSALFHSTHLHDKVPKAMLARFYVGEAPPPQKDAPPTYAWEGDGFYPTLKARVRAHFMREGQARGLQGAALRRTHHGTRAFLLRFGALVASFLALSVGALGFGQWWCALLWGPIAFALGGYGHEAMHAGVFSSVRANRILALCTLDLMGVSSFVFTAIHVPKHHVHTNQPGLDPDIEVHFPLLREFAHQPRRWFHGFQHIYAWLVYTVTFPVLLVGDIVAALTGCWFGPWGKIERPYRAEALLFCAFKAMSVLLWYALPYVLLPWPHALVIHALMIGGTGLMVQGTFALSHQNAWALGSASRTSSQPRDWGAGQLETTVNFQHGHWLPVTLFGGLGYQIEHHLFPTISYSRLHEIVPIVRETCREFGVPYTYYPTALAALGAHYHYLRAMGARASSTATSRVAVSSTPVAERSALQR